MRPCESKPSAYKGMVLSRQLLKPKGVLHIADRYQIRSTPGPGPRLACSEMRQRGTSR